MRSLQMVIDIENLVEGILKKYADLTVPVKIEQIAKQEGIKVMPYPLGEDASGLLVIEKGQIIIGYNQTESRVRRRFTIAHELGHYFLHRDQYSMFVDKQFRIYRSSNSSNQTLDSQKLEQEANAFAAAILMPSMLVQKEIETNQVDFGSEEEIRLLAKKFDVSTTAMQFRLANLEYY